MTDNKLSKQEVHPGKAIIENIDQLLHTPNDTANTHLGDVNEDLTATTEHDAGEGQLTSKSNSLFEATVDYDLKVWSGITGKSAKSSPPTIVRHYAIKILPRNQQTIPDGEYELETANEFLTVKKSGQDWIVVT